MSDIYTYYCVSKVVIMFSILIGFISTKETVSFHANVA